jgi:hypothetical protein
MGQAATSIITSLKKLSYPTSHEHLSWIKACLFALGME